LASSTVHNRVESIDRLGSEALLAAVLVPILTVPVAIGPFLFGRSLPVLLALALADRVDPVDPVAR